AADYLILSAALSQAFTPQTSWTLLLAERFDVRSGRCLVQGIAPEQVPVVRVSDSQAVPLEATELLAAPQRGPGAPEELLASGCALTRPQVVAGNDRTTPRVLTVPEIEGLFGHGGGLTYQWDAEDGSDRHSWSRPRDRVAPAANFESSWCDRVLRVALESWN